MRRDGSGRALVGSTASRVGTAILLALILWTGSLCVGVPRAHAYQATLGWTGSTGTNTSATSHLPSGLHITMAVASGGVVSPSNTSITTLGESMTARGGTPAMYQPALPVTTSFLQLTAGIGCEGTGSCGAGTLTVTFSRPVRDPIMHVAGIGAIAEFGPHRPSPSGSTTSHVVHHLVSSTPPGATLAPVAAGATNLTDDGTTVDLVNPDANVTCSSAGTEAAVAGCGSIRVIGTVTSLTFQLSLLPTAGDVGTPAADTYDIAWTVRENFGIAPASYDGSFPASHVIGDLRLGSVENEQAASTLDDGTLTPSPTAEPAGTNLNGLDPDEDGVTSLPAINVTDIGSQYSVPVHLSGASSAGMVCGWIDFNRSGTFAAAEKRACASFLAGASSVTLNWTVPLDLTAGPTYARFRASYDTAGVQSPTGALDSGEVEDYSLQVIDQSLHISKTANRSVAVSGQQVTYTITVTNTGPTAITGASFTDGLADVLDDATYNGDATASVGTVAYAAPALSWSGDLAIGASASITYSATVNSPDTGNHVLRNTVVSATPGGNCPSGSTDPVCSTQVAVPGLHISKSVSTPNTTPGQQVTYTITVSNTGATAITGANFTDSLSGVVDDATYDGDANASTGSVSYAALVLSWTGDLAVGASATITYSVTVDNPDTGDHQLINTVVSTTPDNNCPSGSTDPACTIQVPVQSIRIVKSANASVAVPGQTVTYTVTVTNTGNTSITGATFTDDLTDVVDDATYNSDAIASAGSVSYAARVLSWTGDLATGESAAIVYSVTVDDPDTGNHSLDNTVVSSTPGGNCAAGSIDPNCDAHVDVTSLAIVKSVDTSVTRPGQTVGYTITVTNTGSVTIAGASFTDSLAGDLDDASYDGDATASAGTASYSAPVLSWTGDLAPGDSATITYSVTVHVQDTGNHRLTNTVVSETPGNNCPAGSVDPACGTQVPVASMHITKSANGSVAVPGQRVTYTIVVTNTGATPLPGSSFHDDLSGVLDDATYDGDANASSGVVSYGAPMLSWLGDLPLGGTAVIDYSVTVHDPDHGDKALDNTVTSTDPGSNCADGTGRDCSAHVKVTGLAIVKSVDRSKVDPGQRANYTVSVTNTGAAPIAGASFTDSLAGVLHDASFDGDAAASTGSVSYAAPVLSWTGDLAPGQSATVTYSITVKNPDTYGHLLTNTVVSPTPGNNCSPGSTDPVCTAQVEVEGPAAGPGPAGLAWTGTNLVDDMVLGALLLAAGLGAVGVSRRRSR